MKNIKSDQADKPLKRKTTIGGQALIEGLMMIGPTKKAIAIRKPDGTIQLEELPMTAKTGAKKILFVRGAVLLFSQLVSGTKALLRSAEFFEEEENTAKDGDNEKDETSESSESAETAKPVKPDSFFKKLGKRIESFVESHATLMLYLSAVVGILFSVVLFMLLPNLIVSLITLLAQIDVKNDAGWNILVHLLEGVIRIGIFIAYLVLANRMKEIRRVWMYHGAEHKTIACYEDNQELTVDNVRLYSRFHPRCGTAFLFVVLIISIIVFSFVGWFNVWINLLIRFALVPIIVGIAYELIRLTGRFDNPLTRAFTAPGLWLQRLTTAEPDDSMIEVAIVAMTAVIPDEPKSDNW